HPGAVLFPSRLQLSGLGLDPLPAAVHLHEVLGVPIVARLDVEGAAAIGPQGTWRVYDSAVSVTDTTGAGDAMAAATLAALACGSDLAEATALGVSVARFTLAGWGHLGLVGPSPIAKPLPGVHIE